jgi:hypothetical protein
MNEWRILMTRFCIRGTAPFQLFEFDKINQRMNGQHYCASSYKRDQQDY